jgi:multiple sugar transport system permease protein
MSNKINKAGYIFVLPYIIYFGVFTAFPLVFSFLLVFHRWDIISPMTWVGFENFVRLSKDMLFFKSIGNTIIFLLIHIPLQIIIDLLLGDSFGHRISCQWWFRES